MIRSFQYVLPALILAFALASAPASAQDANCPESDFRLAGGYELQDVHEVGSILILAPDGRFGYNLIVGAYEEEAVGCWQRQGRQVILDVSEMRVNDGNRTFRKMILDVKSGARLLRSEQGKPWGTYKRVQRF